MKNVEQIPGSGYWNIHIPGLRPTGWGVEYLAGMDGDGIKPGYWLSQWSISRNGMSVVFNFESDLVMTFHEESEANQAVEVLRQNAEIEALAVKIT